MEKRLDKIPFIKVRSDDILISWRNVEHLENLKPVLSMLIRWLKTEIIKVSLFTTRGYIFRISKK